MRLNQFIRQALSLCALVFLTGGLASAATVAPTLTITNPHSGTIVTNSYLTVKGTAREGDASPTNTVSSVVVLLNGTNITVFGTTNWDAAIGVNSNQPQPQVVILDGPTSISLTPGTNVIAAYAVNSEGQFSRTNIVYVFYRETAKLFARVFGRGELIPNYNGLYLNINLKYTMTAVAGAGFRFTNWTVLGTTNTSSVTNPRLTFQMVSNLQLIANMVDIERPVVAITPQAAKSASSVFTINGHARDNLGVADVFYQIGDEGWNVASTTNAFTNWSAVVILGPGRTTISVYAQDAAGNRSKTNTVTLDSEATGLAPESLNGIAVQGVVGGQPFMTSFGPATYSYMSLPPTNFDVGTYTYTLIDSNTAKLGLVSMLDTSSNFLTLAFTNNTGGIFTNAEGVTGPFTLAGLGLVVPSSLNGLTMHGEDTAFYGFTNVFGDGTLVSTEPGGSSTGTFAFMPCSPASGLLIETFSNVVDYALLSFGVTSNTYETISVVGGNITASDSGAFTLSGEAATRGYKAPLSIAHLLGTVTIVKTDGTRRASVISFDPGSFGQFSASTNNNSDGEVYSYVRTGTNTAIFVMGSGNNSDSNEFYFVGPRTATFTNSDSRGVVTFTAAPNFVPLSVVGKKLRATPAGGPPTIVTLGYGTFTGSESTNVVTGSYTFAPYGSNVATTQVSYTDSKNAGETDSIVFWFSSPIAGRYEDTDNSGRVTIGTFTLE